MASSEIIEVEAGSPEYQAILDLRFRILREPLDLDWSEEDLAHEEEERHFGIMKGEQPIACVVIRELGGGTAKLRQMAVETDRQGSGWGRRLVEEVEEILLEDGLLEIELCARDEVVGFYEVLGYEIEGAPFEEIGIPHVAMKKALES